MEEKKSYLQKLAAQLQDWDSELDQLKLKAEQAKSGAKAEIEEQITELRAKKDAAMVKFNQLQEASDEAWDDIKAGAEKSWAELKGAFKNAFSKFNK